MIPLRPISLLILAIIVAVLATGCVFGPEITRDAELTQDDCDQAVHAVLRMLPDESLVTKIVAGPGCPGYWRGCFGGDERVIGVETSFADTTQRAQYAVDRKTWKPGGATYTSQAPFTP